MMWLSNRPADALRWSERALADVSPDSDIHDLAVAELLAAVSMSDLAKLRSYPVLDEILTRANDGWVPDAAALAGTLATVLPFTLGDHRLIMPLVERALTDDLWRLDAPPYGLRPDFVICGCLFADELERGMALADEGVRRARVVGDAVRVGQYSYWRAMIARSGGDLPVVLDAAYDALEAIAGTGYEMSLPYCAGLAALAHLELDESHAANDVLARADKSGVGHAISNLGADDARVHALLACGRPDDARRLAQSVAERLTALHRRDEPTITWRIGATKAALAAGDRASACDLAHEEISIARATHYRGRLGRALRNAVAVCDTGSDAVELLNEAVSVLATTPCQLALAHALVDLGSELHAQGHIEAARDALAQGRELASRCDAPPLAARALAALHATGARPRRTERRGPESLTPAERRVVDLAAAGMTNRQIGEELVLAPRTVEWHLGHAFKKLGVGSRRELSDSLKHG
jgi:DNA-binding CsgD family transcriptional regulator